MIPILYDKGETEFASNGLGRLADCLSCKVTEERNGIYECQFTYPVTGDMYAEIQEGRIVGVIHDDVHDIQPFDIYSRSAPLNGVVTFYAHHISYRLGNVILKPMTAQSCAAAFAAIPNNTYTGCPFTFWTDKAASGTWKNEVPSAVKAILGGQAGSILDVYGKGEYEWDGWTVKLYANRGTESGVSIRYGVNLTDLKHDIDVSGVYTAVVPFWQDVEGGTVVTLDEGYVKINAPQLVPWTDNNGNEITDNNGNVIYFNAENSATLLKTTVLDLTEAFEEQPTKAQLRTEALRRLNNSEAWLPNENITVKFVDLAHTEEYKAVAALQRVKLCDRVSVYCGPLGVSAVSMQVIRVTFNVLTERYDEIQLGKARTSFAQAITDTVEKLVEDKPTVSMMQQAIDNATDRITGAKGGHILDIYDANGKRQEMVILDTEDINTAVNVWRWNMGGLGFSRNGYSGPYGLAITQDGHIVADYITTGTMSANIIRGGILTLGGANDVLGKLAMVNDVGDTSGTWDSNGLSVGGSSNVLPSIGFNRHDNGERVVDFRLYTYTRTVTREECQGLRLYVYMGDSGEKFNLADFDGGASQESIAPSTTFFSDMTVRNGDLKVYNGTKSRVVSTDQYSDRRLYCYEMPSPMFGDVGEGVIAEDGISHIWLDPVFAQTIATSQYQVFLQCYGAGECHVEQRSSGGFTVAGTPGLAFGWEVKAKQRDHDQLRLPKDAPQFMVPPQTYGADAAKHIDEIRKEREAA